MSEWLSTGKMIEEITHGDVFELANPTSEWNQYKKEQMQVRVTSFGDIKYLDGEPLTLTQWIRVKAKWEKVEKYVTFEEATSALKEKKCRYAKLSTDTGYIVFEYYTTKPYDLSLKQLVEGKWQIIE